MGVTQGAGLWERGMDALPRGRGCGSEGWTGWGSPRGLWERGVTDGRRPGAGLVSRDRVNASQIVINIVSQN